MKLGILWPSRLILIFNKNLIFFCEFMIYSIIIFHIFNWMMLINMIHFRTDWRSRNSKNRFYIIHFRDSIDVVYCPTLCTPDLCACRIRVANFPITSHTPQQPKCWKTFIICLTIDTLKHVISSVSVLLNTTKTANHFPKS